MVSRLTRKAAGFGFDPRTAPVDVTTVLTDSPVGNVQTSEANAAHGDHAAEPPPSLDWSP